MKFSICILSFFLLVVGCVFGDEETTGKERYTNPLRRDNFSVKVTLRTGHGTKWSIVHLGSKWNGNSNALEHLKDVPPIREFYARKGMMTDQLLVKLEPLLKDVRILSIFCIPRDGVITDDGLKMIGGLRSLEVLLLWRCSVSKNGLGYLESIPNLTKLDLTGAKISDQDVAAIGRLPQLRYLSLRSTPVSDKGIAHLRMLRKLRVLDLSDTRVAGPGLAHVSRASVMTLWMDETSVTDESIASISGFTNVHDLSFAGTKLTKKSLGGLTSLPNLQELNLVHTQVSWIDLHKMKIRPGLRVSVRPKVPAAAEQAIRRVVSKLPNPGRIYEIDLQEDGTVLVRTIVKVIPAHSGWTFQMRRVGGKWRSIGHRGFWVE